MKIKNIERIWIELPLKEVPWRNMMREIPHWRLFELCRVALDNGSEGVGETMPFYTWGEVTDEAVQRAIGSDPLRIMWDDSLGAGLQMAIFDAVGKSLGTPVWSLLGHRVRELCHVGWWAIDMPAADWISECREAMESGYTTFKTKARPWFDLEDQVRQLTETLPISFKLDIDFNDFGLDPAQVCPLCKRLEQYPQIAIWESPIQQEDTAGNRLLRKQLAIPIAQHIGRPAFETQIRQEICDGFVLEGGVTNAIHYGRMCAEFNKPFWLQWVGSNLGAVFCLHVQAVLSHARWPAIFCNHMYAEQYIQEKWSVSNGMVPVPQQPGIGVTVDWNTVEKYRVRRQPKPYPHPGLLIRVDWPSGAESYFSHAQQMWDTWQSGQLPAFVPGVSMTIVHDDDTPEWSSLQQRASQTPFHVPMGNEKNP